ncbi:hypothetical protein ABIE61_001096 [Marinobacterium sp. MBR-111]|jgi:hypothetical protein|uniref:hypothetical protein n=1 Tax=Marinobacterium sp. MBR-111 TaxID=3156463 RepID=UPI003392950D
MDYSTLKAKHRSLRDGFPSDLSLRIHRSLSWLQKAELSNDDPDAHFIFLWIAFNAAYAIDVDELYRTTERGMFESFFDLLVAQDHTNQLYDLVWTQFSSTIRSLLNNQFIFQPFWDYQNGRIDEAHWESMFRQSKARAAQGLTRQDTGQVLSIVFRRIYTLRNQIVHGGATWQSSVNRPQVRDCKALLSKTVPTILDLMMDNPHEAWGEPFYPVIKDI